jgi:dynamin-binding protein
MIELASGPAILVQKRNDKLLDYESLISKTEKNKDFKVSCLSHVNNKSCHNNSFQVQEELSLAKNTYDALNTQLLEELPIFVELAEAFFVECVTSYIKAKKIFSAKVAKHFLGLMEVIKYYIS